MHRKPVKITLLDIIILFLIITAAAFLFYRIKVQLNYKWNWAVIPQYLFRYNNEEKRWVSNMLMQGFFTTIRLSIWSTFLAIIIGIIMGVFRTGNNFFLQLISRTYVELIRNLPPLVLVFIFYFFISSQLLTVIGVDEFINTASSSTKAVTTFLFAPQARFSAFLSALVTLALYEGAYITEIIRSGIQSVEKGQWEASYALGLSSRKQMQHIILPQAVKKILPPLAGQFISVIKDSAIVSVISIQELTFQGMELMSATYLTFEVWITITVLYFLLSYICSFAVGRLSIYQKKRGSN